MNNKITTTDLSKFGSRERKMLEDLLKAWREQGLPEDFDYDEVRPMMNTQSGYVFLTNEAFQVAMLNGDDLESFYSSPYEGREGFFNDLLDEFDDMHREDQEWFYNIAEQNNKVDELPEWVQKEGI